MRIRVTFSVVIIITFYELSNNDSHVVEIYSIRFPTLQKNTPAISHFKNKQPNEI